MVSLSLEHRVRHPKTPTEQPPLILLLHGYGSNEDDLFSFADSLPENAMVISIRAPYAIQPAGYAWYSIYFDEVRGKWSDDQQAIQARDRIASLIDEIVETYQVNAQNITLMGFSQGAILSYGIALTYPEKVKNVIAMSGYVNENIIEEKESSYDHLDFYCSHGTMDQVVLFEWAKQIPDYLKSKGVQFVFETFPIGHGVSPKNFYSLSGWLSNRL
ncbi:MAG: alpha/beta hydrolase-fold protein [Flavobacteriaceae bacterium]|nr:alpha/beta hydrolase-fold protein [Flavobacteriaceae bacterium]MDG2315071.1 alpha/beta hydrolase-fold protein [Flavobacteriaceae bacterium]